MPLQTATVRPGPSNMAGPPPHIEPIAVRWLPSASLPASATALLDPHELRRFHAFRHAGAARDYLAAHVAARIAVGERLGVRPEQVVFGRRRTRDGCACRPAIPGTGIHLSLSHTRDLGLVAVSGMGPVGVDSEHRGRAYSERLLRRILADGEAREIPEDPRLGSDLLLSTWTRKEAVLKALGTGLAIDPARLVVSRDSVRLFPREPGEKRLAMRTESFLVGAEHICAVAAFTPSPGLRIGRLEPPPSSRRTRPEERV